MVCDDEKCLAPELLDFKIKIKGNKQDDAGANDSSEEIAETLPTPIDTVTVSQNIVPATLVPDQAISQGGGPLVELEPGCGEMVSDDHVSSIWGIFIGGILGGLLAY